ncbi:MAG: DUF2283 domain-containing protein [Candidatus Scalindua sp.]|nr:DUF2283 domain-containing protein [Candidatus Scalindua sp.]
MRILFFPLAKAQVIFTYVTRYNIAYIRFHEKSKEVAPIKISDELVVDMAPDGTVYGIGLLNANEQIKGQEQGKLLIVNEATGAITEMPIHTDLQK